MATLLTMMVAIGCSADASKSRALARANTYFESGEYDKAKIEYLNVLKVDPRNARAIQQLGVIWYEQGAPLNALPFLLAARDLLADDIEIRLKLASIDLSVGQFADARKESLAILDRSPAHNRAMVLFVDASRTRRELDDAEERLRSLNAADKPGFHLALAALSLRKRDLASAESEVRQALSLDPNSIEGHIALARISWMRNDLVRADQEFKAAAELAPLRSAAPLLYADFKARTRAADEAKARLNVITQEAPDFLPAWRLLAQIAFTEEKFNDSLKLLENIVLRDPANIEARVLQAQVQMVKGDVKKALETLESLNTRFPRFPPIKHQLARAYLNDGDRAKASDMLTQAIALNPEFTEAILLLGQINLQAGDPKQVIASMLSLLNKRPQLVEAQLLLAQAYQSLGRLDAAAAVFREQIKVSPKSAQAHFLLGLFLLRQNKIEEARKAIEAAQQLAPESLLPVAQLVDLDIRNKDFDAAFRQVRNQLQRTPESPGPYFLEGKIFAVQGKWDNAETALRKALELDPHSSSAYDLLISTYLAANRLPQAIAALEDLLSKRSDNAEALMVLAQTYERMNDFPKARDSYERLLKVNPDSPFALNNLAYLFSERLDQLDKAYNLAHKARGLLPTDPVIADTLGWILYKKGDYQKALTSLQESAIRLPNNPEVQFHLGMASYMMNDRDGARRAFHQAMAASKDLAGREEVQRRLGLLDLADGKSTSLSNGELQTMLRQQPDDLVTRMLLGESYEKQGAFAEAAATYEEATKLNPKLLSAAIKLAELNAGPLNDSGKALEFARRAREIAPNDPKVLGMLGDAAYQTGNFKWAYSLLQESARRLPNNTEVLYDFAWAAYSMGRVSEARQAVQRLLALSPNSNQQSDASLFLRMTALDQEGVELVATEAEIEKALKAIPNYVPALMAKAERLRQSGEASAAATAYTAILRHFPYFAPAQKHLASLYSETPDKRAEAYELAVKARTALPDDPELAKILAELSYDRQDFAYAVQLLRQSAEKRPLGAKDLYYLGMSHLKTNEKPKSREVLGRALAAGLPDPLAGDARRTLRELDQE